jgi:hypothetical protein
LNKHLSEPHTVWIADLGNQTEIPALFVVKASNFGRLLNFWANGVNRPKKYTINQARFPWQVF